MEYSKLVSERLTNAKDYLTTPRVSSVHEQVVAQQCFNIVEQHISDEDKDVFQRRIQEGYNVSDTEQT